MRKRNTAILITFILLLIILSAFIGREIGRNNVDDSVYVKFQDKMSMDWDSEDEMNLLKIADFYEGTEEDKAYNILVTLNRVCFANGKYGTSVRDVVINQICSEGVSDIDFKNIEISDSSMRAMEMVVMERLDNSLGSCEYRDCR